MIRLPKFGKPPAGRAVPPGIRVYAIGDVHGRLDLLRRLIDRIDRDFAESGAGLAAHLVLLGDYVDRGPDSRDTIEALVGGLWPKSAEMVCLMGNHEDAMLGFLRAPLEYRQWLEFGGQETLESYQVTLEGVPFARRLTEAAARLAEHLPPAHRAFLDGLKLHHTIGDYLFVHAGLRPGLALEDQEREDLLWIREAFLDSRADFGRVVVHGHTPVRKPEIRPNRIAIDTLAFATGVLTALVLEGEGRRFLST